MATTQNFNYPSSSDVTITGIGNPINQPYPTSAVAIAGENPAGLLTPIQTNTAGDLITVQAAGAIDNVNLSQIGGAAITEGQKTSSASIPVVIASDQSTLPVSAASLPLPAGAATSANQVTQETTLSSILANQTNGTQEVSVTNFPATQPVSGTVTVIQPTGTNLHTVVDSSALPTGASTAANQATEITSLASIVTNTTGSATAANQATQITSLNTIALTQGSSTGGTAATDSNLAGGLFHTSPATVLTNGAQRALELDQSGNLRVIQNAANSSVSAQALTPAAFTIHQAAITVGTTAVRLTVVGTTPAINRVVLVATPDSATASTVVFYIGSSTVTNSGATRGIEIQQGQSFTANNDAGDYWIVASVAAQTVTVMEQY